LRSAKQDFKACQDCSKIILLAEFKNAFYSEIGILWTMISAFIDLVTRDPTLSDHARLQDIPVNDKDGILILSTVQGLMMNRPAPIVLAAFGTTTRAMDTYSFIDRTVKAAFAGHPVKWAYTSRMVRSHMVKQRRADMKNPQQVLESLAADGHDWAVVQSLHLICGHEFYRLVEEVKDSAVRTSMGLPLLAAPQDFRDTAAAVLQSCSANPAAATVLIGHGTDHPAWTAYPALAHLLKGGCGNVYVATIEGESAMEQTVAEVAGAGARSVHLIPLMLVAGLHLQEDIAGDEDSWKQAFQKAGLAVSVETEGLGKHPAIIDIFVRHIREALEMVPTR
jgi:sirohydrochlorin cobaltochelatase